MKKQFNKANQFMTERITGAEGTNLDNDFHDMEKRTDLLNEMIEDIEIKTKEYLQPNPTVRAKMAAVKGISKLSGQAKASTYPQPEGTLGEAMCLHGRKMEQYGEYTVLGTALNEAGESMKQIADLKYALDDHVKQNFLEPLHHTQKKDITEVLHHRKKLQGRKLDFDCKKRTGARDEELRAAEEKFAESFQMAQLGMHNLMNDNGVEHISELCQFTEAVLEYHRNCTSILQALTETLQDKMNEAATRDRPDFRPKTLEDLGIAKCSNGGSSGSYLNAGSGRGGQSSVSPGASPATTPLHAKSWDSVAPQAPPRPGNSPASSPMRNRQPSCRALYDFAAENPTELSFKEGDVIMLKEQIDDNWYNGSVGGKSGFFPTNYVQIIVPLP